MAAIPHSFLYIPFHPSLSPAMGRDVASLLSLPLRNWRRWNHRIGEDTVRDGNCHHAATALIMDLVEASAAQGWRIGSGFVRMPDISEPILHSWVETPHGAVVDASQVYKTRSGLAVSKAHWFQARAVEPLIQRRPGQVAWAVRRFGIATAALLPLTQIIDAASAALA